MVYQRLPLYGTIWLIAIAMGTRMLAYCTRTMNSSALQIQCELDEASYVSGVSKLPTIRSIFLPLMAPAIFYSALMVGMLAARDLPLPLVMNTGKQQVVSVLIFDLQTNGAQTAAAAVSALTLNNPPPSRDRATLGNTGLLPSSHAVEIISPSTSTP